MSYTLVCYTIKPVQMGSLRMQKMKLTSLSTGVTHGWQTHLSATSAFPNKQLETSRTTNPSNPTNQANPSLGVQVNEMSDALGELAGDVSSIGSRLESVHSGLRVVSDEHRQITLRAVDQDTVTSLEKRLMDRQARFEGALMQVGVTPPPCGLHGTGGSLEGTHLNVSHRVSFFQGGVGTRVECPEAPGQGLRVLPEVCSASSLDHSVAGTPMSACPCVCETKLQGSNKLSRGPFCLIEGPTLGPFWVQSCNQAIGCLCCIHGAAWLAQVCAA